MKPFSEACERNKVVIFEQLVNCIDGDSNADIRTLLEIGSGTGQHAAYFSEQFKRLHIPLHWQPSDVNENLAGIELWRKETDCVELLEPIAFDLNRASWPVEFYDYVFTANTLHIVSWQLVIALFRGVNTALKKGGLCFIYGPFNYNGCYTSQSNNDFDQWLRSRDECSGIRDFERIIEAAQVEASMVLKNDKAMPANNRFLVFEKQ